MDKSEIVLLARRVLVTAAILSAVVLGVALHRLLLFVLVAVLLAVFWNAVTEWVRGFLSPVIPRTPVLLAVVGGSIGLLAVVVYLLSAPVKAQLGALAEQWPGIMADLEANFSPLLGRLRPYLNGAGGAVADSLPWLTRDALSYLGLGFLGFVLTTAVFFFALFLALTPERYVKGALWLLPPAWRSWGRTWLARTERTLVLWMKATGVSMLFIAGMVTLLLSLIGIEYALLFGVAAGLFELIPFIGPLLAFLGPLLIGLSMSTTTALWVVVAWGFVQSVEGNLIVPAVLSREVSLPPALTILAIVGMGNLFGLLGTFLAAPVLAIMLATVRFAYGRGG